MRVLIAVLLILGTATHAGAQLRMLKYAPSPADNPLRGLVPYAGDNRDKFPHSLEFGYLPLSEVMTGMDQFEWKPLERMLDDIAGRGHQTVFRIWMEYPGHAEGIPEFLVQDGVKVTEWLNTNTDPFPPQKSRTPDYNNPKVSQALKNFIAAMGRKYDGDPRVGYITAGLLGTWGEWHCYPRTELFANKQVQTDVLDAYAAAFRKTPILLRNPAGANDAYYARTDKYPFGYHDDSFCWATLETGKPSDSWYFMPAMQRAGVGEKWKQHPVGGEIRPDLWGQIFDERPEHKMAQDFGETVRQTHATWLLDTGMFGPKPNPAKRQQRAMEQVRRMGFEFHVSSAAVNSVDGQTRVMLTVRNTGIAPMYHDWKIEIGVLNGTQVGRTWQTDWKLTGLLPGETRVWGTDIDGDAKRKLAVRVVNPMQGGLPFRFANEGDSAETGWLPFN